MRGHHSPVENVIVMTGELPSSTQRNRKGITSAQIRKACSSVLFTTELASFLLQPLLGILQVMTGHSLLPCFTYRRRRRVRERRSRACIPRWFSSPVPQVRLPVVGRTDGVFSATSPAVFAEFVRKDILFRKVNFFSTCPAEYGSRLEGGFGRWATTLSLSLNSLVTTGAEMEVICRGNHHHMNYPPRLLCPFLYLNLDTYRLTGYFVVWLCNSAARSRPGFSASGFYHHCQN